jgi:PAS domain S-box-containing protein
MILEPAPSARDALRSPVNILLLDDTPAKLLTYEVVLSGLGENLIKATSADEAFQILLKIDVALVLADVSMPTVDGFEFAKILRGHPRFEGMPIVFVSAIAQSDVDRLQGYARGAVDYLFIPVAPELLRAKVKTYVDHYRRQRELEILKRELEARVTERTTELEASMTRLALSEERYRMLVDNANDIVAMFDLKGRFTSVNPAIERILGFAPAEVIGRSLRRQVPQEQLRTHVEMLNRTLHGASSTPYEVEALTKVGVRRVLEVNSALIADAAGKPVAIHAIARDITERKEAKRAEAHIAELDHRVKNALATVIAVSQRTREGYTSMDEFVSAFDGRIRSMAEAHALLSSGRWQGVNLAQLVRQELAPCAAALNTMVEGPDIVLVADAAQPVAFVLHELVTNAAKYGALSIPKGHVSVQWHQRANGHVPGALVLDWKETGGPRVPTSITPGYGTSVVKDLIPYELGGVVDLVFAPEGVRCRLEIPGKWLSDADRPLS